MLDGGNNSSDMDGSKIRIRPASRAIPRAVLVNNQVSLLRPQVVAPVAEFQPAFMPTPADSI